MMAKVDLTKGSEDWHKMRRLATKSVPGRHSALYYLNNVVLGKGPLIPMTYRAHFAMCLFAESATGIKEIDEARVKLILVPRGVGKSSLVTKALPLLGILRDPEFACGIANEKQDLANTFLGDLKSEIESNQLLRALFPEIVPPDFRKTVWAADRIITRREKSNPTSPSILATGTSGTVTGVHMNMWVCDDLLSQNAAENAFRGSFSEIEAVNRWTTRLQPLLKNPKGDPLIFIGTRWWEGDTYEFIEEFYGHGESRKEYILNLHLPAQVSSFHDGNKIVKIDRPPEHQKISLYKRDEVAIFKFPAIDEAGRAIFPERYDLDVLQTMQQEDPVFFAGQYLLEPTSGAASHFDPEWLNYYTWDGKTMVIRNQDGQIEHISKRDLVFYISVDPAFSKSHTAARTAIPVIGTDGKRLFLMEDYAERMDDEDAIANKVFEFFLEYNPQKIFVETIVAQVAVANAIRRTMKINSVNMDPIEEIKSHGKASKNMRIYGLQNYFKRGNFYANKVHTKFIQEYTSFPRGALRDLLDAIAFQKDEWEKLFHSNYVGGRIMNQTERMDAERKAMDRVREATSGRRGRRRR
jgi:hypothetical protein